MGLLVILNNYLHDLATGTWLAANAFQWAMLRRGRGACSEEMRETLRPVRWVSRIALVWIIVGGVIRAAAYRTYEWSDAAGRGQTSLLIAKHVLLFAMVAAGLWMEWRVDREWSRAE